MTWTIKTWGNMDGFFHANIMGKYGKIMGILDYEINMGLV